MNIRAVSTILTTLLVFALLGSTSLLGAPNSPDPSRVHLVLDTSEASILLNILSLCQANKPITDADWQSLFTSEPYVRLKARQEAIAQRFHAPSIVLRDSAFKAFVMSDNLLKQAADLRATLNRWSKANLDSAAHAVLGYLPTTATIRATIYPVIKDQTNSFVWEASTNPAIFLYLDPEVTADKFANTVTHELHHIGLASVNSNYYSLTAALPAKARTVAEWVGSFGEGMAMLAAAGSPDIHPHASSPQKEHDRWDRDMANFDSNLLTVDSFFTGILNGTLSSQDSIETRGSSYYGVQGPWYTVGYRMCVMVEKRFGRPALIETMLDPRKLLVLYNRAAKELNEKSSTKLPLWSEDMLKQFGAE